MGLLDAFGAEDRIEITKSEYHQLLKNTAKLDEIMTAIQKNIPNKYIKIMFNIEEEKNDGKN